ncbi:Hok/Gef family protein [bacterium]|nr:Hok/Gef family protein [bacterium]
MMTDAVWITLIICVTVIAVAWIGRDRKK